MGVLSEQEIFGCLAENFRLAAQHCEDLATLPEKGPTYIKFREELKLIEGSCRQAGHWREDSRWFRLGFILSQAHQRAGDWLRGLKNKDGSYTPIPAGQKHPLFMMLAAQLRDGHRKAEDLRTKKTGRRGIILPDQLPAPHRDHTPKSMSGLILPPDMIHRSLGSA